MNTIDFIALVAPGAQAGMRNYSVLASPSMAQGICESGSGAHAPGNNLFGIKATPDWKGPVQRLLTREVVNGKSVYVYADFRVYTSLADSIADHGAFLAANARYKNLLGNTDYKTVCKLLQADGYATALNYAESLIFLIEQYGLDEYDLLPITHIDTPTSGATVKGAFDIKGWAISLAGIARVDVYIDSKIGLASIKQLTARPDVAKAYPKYSGAGTSGFAVSVPNGKLKSGNHSIDVAAIDKDGMATWAHLQIIVK